MSTNPRSGSHVSAAAAAVALAVASLWLTGCTAGDASVTSVAAAGPPGLWLVDPADGACVVLQNDDGWTARVSIGTSNWLMRPAGFCGSYPQCGYVVAFVDDQRVAQGAALVVDVPFRGLETPAGEHRIRLELRDDADQVARGADGKPLSVELKVNALEPGGNCSGSLPDAGDGGPEDAADDVSPDAANDAADAGEDALVDAGDELQLPEASPDAQDAASDAADDAVTDAAPEAEDVGDAAPPDSSLSD